MSTIPKKLKIASWNINSVRFRVELVERFLREEQPDILCLQETKVVNNDFPAGMFLQLGYNFHAIHGQPMHHGVAILSKIPIREDQAHDWQDNGEARHVGVLLDSGIRIENVYIPAGGETPDTLVNSKFGQKLAFLERMTRWSEKLKQPTILLGDFNIAPLECDVWNHKALIDVVSHTPIEIDLLTQLQNSHAWVDIGRRFFPAPEKHFTWWSYRARDWQASDRGRRLDHVWASPEIAGMAKSHTVHRASRSWQKPSDHIPLITELVF